MLVELFSDYTVPALFMAKAMATWHIGPGYIMRKVPAEHYDELRLISL